jgi:predicted Rossmann fold nucleotide-binding protein DprA/Smf involved in DNA uptake
LARASLENCSARWVAPTGFSAPRLPNWNRIGCLPPSRRRSTRASRRNPAAYVGRARISTALARDLRSPPLLYVRGNIELLNRHRISIVGSRRPTPYGNQMAERLAGIWPDRGLVIVSGLARGMDSSAHKAALSSAAGATIDVLGCETDVIYPKENKKIFAEMESRGAIISVFTMGTSRPAELPDSQSHYSGDV